MPEIIRQVMEKSKEKSYSLKEEKIGIDEEEIIDLEELEEEN